MAEDTRNRTVEQTNADATEQTGHTTGELKDEALEGASGGLGDTATHEVGHRKRG